MIGGRCCAEEVAERISTPRIGRRQSAVLKREFVIEVLPSEIDTHTLPRVRAYEALCNLPYEREHRRPYPRQPMAACREPHARAVRALARAARRWVVAHRPCDRQRIRQDQGLRR